MKTQEEPKKSAESLKEEKSKEDEQRKEQLKMRQQNLLAPSQRPDVSFFKSLDSTHKKNSSFISKLKNKISQDTEAGLSKELQNLNLNRYISEVVQAIASAPLRMNDVPSAIRICSLMHKYYAEFMPELVPSLVKIFHPEKNETTLKKRSTLRLLTELITYGLYTDYCELLGIVESIVKDFDNDPLENLALAQSFVRYAVRDILGIERRLVEQLEGENEPKTQTPQEKIEEIEIMKKEGRYKFNVVVKELFKRASQLLVKLHTNLRAKESENREIENTKGELSEDIVNAYKKQREEYEKVLSSMNSLADLLQCDLPVLPEEEKVTRLETPSGDSSKPGAKESPLWEDEGMRSFYEDLEDLSTRVNPSLLGLNLSPRRISDSEKKEPEMKETEKKEPEIKETEKKETEKKESEKKEPEKKEPEKKEPEKKEPEKKEPEKKEPEKKEPEKKESEKVQTEKPKESEHTKDEQKTKEETTESTHQQDRFVELLSRLESSINKEKIDQAAIDFCHMSNKGNRKRLVNALFAAPRTKLEILPYYSRLIAILNQYMKDVGNMIVQKLEYEFDLLYAEKHQLKIESKIKNIRFIAELVKFKVCPPTIAFKCLKMCLDDFVYHNVDVACALLETCGRFLYKVPETHMRCRTMIERMMRLKESKNFDNKQETMIENAYFSCHPPDKPAIQVKERTPLVLFMRKLIYEDLHDQTALHVMQMFRKFDWVKDEWDILKVLLKVHKGKYSTIHNVASIVSGLAKYHEEFGIKFVDSLLDEIWRGLEVSTSGFTSHQKLTVYIKFLGELYNYSLIDHPLIFDTLYYLITPSQTDEQPDFHSELFRIRLVCTLLDTCGEFFNRGSTKERLDRFLAYYQVFCLSKNLPPDVVFSVDDTFESLRPKLKRHTTAQEAIHALGSLERKPGAGPKSYIISTIQDEEVEEDYDTNDQNDNDNTHDNKEEPTTHVDDENTGIRPKASEYIPCVEDDDFARQYEQMLSEDRESRKTVDKSNINLPVPTKLLKRPSPANQNSTPENQSEGVSFSLILKKGNKPKPVEIQIPKDTNLVLQHLKAKEEQEKQQEALKRRVLEYEERERKQEEETRKMKQNRPEEIDLTTPYPQNDRNHRKNIDDDLDAYSRGNRGRGRNNRGVQRGGRSQQKKR